MVDQKIIDLGGVIWYRFIILLSGFRTKQINCHKNNSNKYNLKEGVFNK